MDEAQKEEVFKQGTVSVIKTKDQSELLSVKSESITIDIDTSSKQKIEVPFQNQDVVLYQDFDFDKVKDLAIQEFFSSKGPAYVVYLCKDNRFIIDSAFTEIIQSSQGNFSLDSETNTIHTMSGGGCCWHSIAIYSIINGNPRPVEMVIEKIDLPFTITTTKKWTQGKVQEIVERTIDLNQEGIIEVMSFNLLHKNKRVLCII